MNKYFTSKSELYLLALGFMALIASCSPRVEGKQDQEATAAVNAPAVKPAPVITVASIEQPAQEVYFDLLANTTSCLGETLWIGGKAESEQAVSMDETGAVKPRTVFKLSELTATGLESNKSYTLQNTKGTIKAVCDENGILQINMGEGQLQLVSVSGEQPIILAHEAIPVDAGYVARWSCQ